MISRVLLAAALLVPSIPVQAGQSLIPSPYPSGVIGAQPLDPEPTREGGHQRLIRDPYPQILGDDAQGNPPLIRRRRHQRLVSSIYKRKYRVERHGR